MRKSDFVRGTVARKNNILVLNIPGERLIEGHFEAVAGCSSSVQGLGTTEMAK